MDQPVGRQARGAAQASREDPVGFARQLADFVVRNARWLMATALIMLCVQDIFGTHGLIAMRRSRREAAQIQRQIAETNRENQQIESRVKSLKTDPAAIERIAREQLGLARPGEYIFKLPKSGEAASPNAAAANPQASTASAASPKP